MKRRVLVPLASAFALLSLVLPLSGALAAFPGYDGGATNLPIHIAYDDGVATSHRTGSDFTTPVLGTDPVWRADAAKIAFVKAATSTLATADADGSNQHDLGITGSEPTWNASGTKLAYVKVVGGHKQIYSVDVSADGATASNETPLSNSTTEDVDPAWSVTGSIAFTRQVGGATGKFQIFVMNSDGSGQTQLTSAPADDTHPTFSPDGGTIAFQSNRSGNEQIYTMSSSGGNPTRVTNSSGNDRMPAFSPEGDAIVFARQGTGIVTRSLNTGSETAVSSGPTDANPDWRPRPPHYTGTSAPTISGSIQVGSTVFATTGSWEGATSFSYQWKSCTGSTIGTCSNISGATSSTYTVQSSDQGKGLAVTVTASNAAGASPDSADSNVVTGVEGPGPQIHVLPKITVGFGSLENAPTIGFSVFTSTGTWESNLPLTFTYQWRMCERNDGPCSDIPGATTSTLIVPPQAIGRELIAAVTAHNSAGDTYAESPRSLPVTGLAPHSKQTPPILGTNEVGQTLTVGPGLWTGSLPFTYTFDWRRCDAFGNLNTCVSIPGARQTGVGSGSYTLQQADVDYTIRVYITAHNAVGDATIITNHTFPTLPKRKFIPSATTPPSITGVLHPGRTLTASPGFWSGDTPIQTQVFWRRCNAVATACVTLDNKKLTYKLTKKDLGHTFIIVVNATNAAGTTQATSLPTDVVSLTPARKKGRRIVGTNGANYLGGSAFDDTIIGKGGNDTIKGGAGNDLILGGPGDDVIDGGSGSDRIDGGPGSDTITTADGAKDVVDCGTGQDRVVADPDDVLKNCEAVTYASGTTGEKP